jgi:hypothetical protein
MSIKQARRQKLASLDEQAEAEYSELFLTQSVSLPVK